MRPSVDLPAPDGPSNAIIIISGRWPVVNGQLKAESSELIY
jgi:hypothetical protein